MVVLERFFFSLGRQIKWLLVALDRWSTSTVTNVWEFAWADSALVVLDEWSSYRGGRLKRFGSIDVSDIIDIHKCFMKKKNVWINLKSVYCIIKACVRYFLKIHYTSDLIK